MKEGVELAFTEQHANLYLLGKNYLAHQFLGAHLNKDKDGNIISTTFNVYAPNAKEVRLIADFNNYEGWKHVLSKIHPQGFWSISIPKNLEWSTYKYEFHLHDGRILHKADPFAFFAELRPSNGSKVYDIEGYYWHDDTWFYEKKKVYDQPMLIYELHLGSWQRNFGEFRKYNEVVADIIQHVKYNGFTHVELLPIYEHPLDDSWGYQGTGFFAATSRYGTPKDLMYFIDQCHQHGIGVIIDWVLGHINKDSFGLFKFDGTYLYEYEDEKRRENITWGTANLDFNKGISRSFMLSALTFWMDYFHVDGFRIDAVSHLFYHLGDESKGQNIAAINYLKELSTILFSKDETLIFSAEDSTAYPKVTHPVSLGGIGFNYKWNMGFMNDTLKYFKLDPIHRKYHSDLITFSMVYAYNEQFILPSSHDEVVHMKGSLVNKMPGDLYSKIANWKLLLTYQITFPGKKLLFMGQEFAQFSEWNNNSEIDWFLIPEHKHHHQAARFFRDLTKIYKTEPALYELDHNPNGFKWLIMDHHDSSVFSYIRKSSEEMLVVILNMTPNFYDKYEVGVPLLGYYEEIFNSDKDVYGANHQYNGLPLETKIRNRNNFVQFINVKIASFGAIILKYKKELKKK